MTTICRVTWHFPDLTGTGPLTFVDSSYNHLYNPYTMEHYSELCPPWAPFFG
jgi:hypothetical protein